MDASGTTTSQIDTGTRTEQKKIGEASLECFYEYRWLRDTTDMAEGVRTDVMVLQIGDGLSRFYSYSTMKADSLLMNVTSPDEVLANIGKFKGGETFNVYKNYPSGRQTFTDRISSDWYSYDEQVDIEWELGDRTKEIEGYECREATCTFRGREYTAWFAPEIPVSEGPWKFSGLPGLIMEVSDSKGHYSYLLTGLRQVVGVPVTIADVNYHKTNRREYLQTKHKFDSDPVGFLGLMSGVQLTVVNPDGSPNTSAMEPKALKYEYAERDYR